MATRLRSERGQTTVEWVGLVLLVAVLMAAMSTLGLRVPGAGVAHGIAKKMLCAASLAGACGEKGSLNAAYGPELAGIVRARVPTLFYGRDMLGLPVDYRTCRSAYCAEGQGEGEVGESVAGEPVTLFTRVIDCRDGVSDVESHKSDEQVESGEKTACGSEKDGSIYVQYWAYYPESASLRGIPVLEGKGFHPHDWESTQIRVGPDGKIAARASSHAGYNYRESATNWGADLGWGFLEGAAEKAGLRSAGGWGPVTGRYLIAGGSHAGNVDGRIDQDRYPSHTPAGMVRLVPLESVKDDSLSRPARFDPITPPWRKGVWNDPESVGTG